MSLVLILVLGLPVTAPSARGISERELAAEVAAGVSDGTVQWMTAGSDRFPVIVHEPARETAAGVVLIVPAPGEHADWPEVVRPLRLGLPEQGWRTVSVQMPASQPGGSFRDSARARARLAFMLESLGATGEERERLVVLAVGRAYQPVAALLMEALAQAPERVHGLVLVSPSLPAAGVLGGGEDPLTAFAPPMLELRGGEAEADVVALLDEHARVAARGDFEARREVVVMGARADFRAQSKTLVRRVRGWLTTLPPLEEP